MPVYRTFICLICLIFAFFTAHSGVGAADADWLQWRGPNRDGISPEKDWNPASLSDGAAIQWKIDLGRGYSSVTVQGNFVYTMGNKESQDIVYCLDFETGEIVWTFSYPQGLGQHPGPRATPTIDGNRVYTISRSGDLYCLSTDNGTVIWQVNVSSHGARSQDWGYAGSVCVEDDLIILNAGSTGLALNKMNGSVAWKSSGRGGFATPVPFTYNRTRYVALFGSGVLNVVEMKSGKLLWSFPWRNSADVNAADPVIFEDKIFISTAYGKGSALLQLRGKNVTTVWESGEMRNHFSSSLYLDGYIYGIDGDARYNEGSLKCIDVKSGKVIWSQHVGMGSLMAAAGKLIVLTDRGELVIAEASPSGYREFSRSAVIGRTAWTPPVLSRGRIFCRNDWGELACVDVR